MRFIFAIAAMAAAAIAAPLDITPRGCATPELNATTKAELNRQITEKLSSFAPVASAVAPTVNVHFHTIIDRQGNGNLTDEAIAAQIKVLNDDYAGNFKFVLASSDREVNARWFKKAGPGTNQQDTMKKCLRKGGPADLNIYSVGFKEGDAAGLLGYATFPFWYKDAPKDDGV
ncbi:hypothetical protein HDU97_009883, partial [Phlyctochytrium planicorne]